MKKTRIIVGVLALAVVSAIVIACTKEKETKVEKSSNQMTTVSKEDDMSAYLKQFKEKMQSAEKGDEVLSLEDARWHLEAVLNYTYGDAGHLFSDIQCDTFYYKLPVCDEEITFGQLNEAFKVFSNNVEKVYEECTLPEKRILAIQTRFNNESKDDEVSVQVILRTGGISTTQQWFDSTDYWHDYYYEDGQYGFGKCGPYVGQGGNSGAPKELERLSNLRIPAISCGHGYRVYMSEVEDVWLNPIQNSPYMIDENSPCGYKIYFNCDNPEDPSHNPSHCIPPSDMNYYLSQFTEIMIHYKPNGKQPICATYLYSTLLSESCVDDLYWLVIQYGTVQCIPNPLND